MKTFGTHIKIDRTQSNHLQIFGTFVPPVITQDTEIIIWFDSSGSMDDTLSPLETMRDTILKDTLLPFYNNDGDLYDEKVTVQSWSDERTFRQLAIEPDNVEDGIIHLVFQDEAHSVYHSSTSSFNGSRTSTYNTDISALRDKLANTFPTNKYKAFIFQVVGSSGFKSFLEAVENGTGNYADEWGLSDKDEVTFVYNVNDGDTAQYYADLIEENVLD